MKTTCVCSLSTREIADLAAVSSSNHLRYALSAGATYVHHTGVIDSSRHPSWSKLLLVSRLLTQYERVLWIDADAVFLPEAFHTNDWPEASIACYTQPKENSLNFGIAYFTRSETTLKMIGEAYFAYPMAWDCPWWEQQAWIMMNWVPRPEFKIMPHHEFVVYPDNWNAHLQDVSLFAHACGPFDKFGFIKQALTR